MAASKGSVFPIKSDLTKKLEIIKELQQLRIKEQNLEKDKTNHVYDRRAEAELSALQELDVKLKAERNAESLKMKQHYTKICNLVQKFQQELQNVQPSAQFVERLKVMMEEAEEQISLFKEQQRTVFEQLLKDERLIGLEVSSLEKHIESWSQADSFSSNVPKSHKQPISQPTHDLPQEVAAFENFLLRTGGNRGGWDEYDHVTFLKHRNRFKGKVAFIKELAGFLPTRSEQDIRDHEVWYQEYLLLNEKKKEAIEKWRERKEIEKEEVVAKAGQSDLDRKAEADKEEESKKLAIQKEKEEKRVLLNRWKIEKELHKAEEEEKRLRTELEKQKRDELDRQKKMDLKRKVNEYRSVKEKEEEELRIEELIQLETEREVRHRQSSALIAKFRDRDLEAVKQKRENEEKEKKRIEQEKAERLERLKSMVEVNVERDPSRLLQPTELWKARQKEIGPSGSGPLLHMPRRAVPTWRQGLS